eukprot:768042-Hanusia_phi.AAC.4
MEKKRARSKEQGAKKQEFDSEWKKIQCGWLMRISNLTKVNEKIQSGFLARKLFRSANEEETDTQSLTKVYFSLGGPGWQRRGGEN